VGGGLGGVASDEGGLDRGGDDKPDACKGLLCACVMCVCVCVCV
jgi:hypothetical protein